MYFKNKKQFFKYPGTLFFLSTQALGRLVSSVLFSLVNKKDDQAQAACEYIRQLLHESLPETIRSEVQTLMLRHVEVTYSKMYKMEKKMNSVKRSKDLCTKMFLAILTPLAVKLESFVVSIHPELSDGYKLRNNDLMCSVLPKLKNLKVLKLGLTSDVGDRNWRFQETDITDSIEEFHCQIPTENEFTVILTKCPKLRVLNIDMLLVGYEETIPLIPRCRFLEHLNILDYEDMLDELSNTYEGKHLAEGLKSFSCHSPSMQHIDLLGEYCPNLVSLCLIYPDSDLTTLCGLKHLRHVRVESAFFNSVSGLLKAIGKQLKCLELRNIYETDLGIVAQNCTSVNCLHLDRSPNPTGNFTKMQSVTFPEVERLELYFHNERFTEHVFSYFENVKKLYLLDCTSLVILNQVLKRKFMKKLEFVYFKNCLRGFLVVQIREKDALITEFPYYNNAPIVNFWSKLL